MGRDREGVENKISFIYLLACVYLFRLYLEESFKVSLDMCAINYT